VKSGEGVTNPQWFLFLFVFDEYSLVQDRGIDWFYLWQKFFRIQQGFLILPAEWFKF